MEQLARLILEPRPRIPRLNPFRINPLQLCQRRAIARVWPGLCLDGLGPWSGRGDCAGIVNGLLNFHPFRHKFLNDALQRYAMSRAMTAQDSCVLFGKTRADSAERSHS